MTNSVTSFPVYSIRVQLSLVRFCLICGQNYGGLLSASLNHILSSACFRDRSVCKILVDKLNISTCKIDPEKNIEVTWYKIAKFS
jgi:hypothetical protein